MKYLYFSLFALISHHLWKIKNSGINCTAPNFSSIAVGVKYMDGVTCNICECKETGKVECIYHIKCDVLDCERPDYFELRCCHELNCPNNTNSNQIFTKENTAKTNIIYTEHPYAPKSAKHGGWIVLGIFCVFFVIIIVISFIKKSRQSPFRLRRPRAPFNGYVRFDKSFILQ